MQRISRAISSVIFAATAGFRPGLHISAFSPGLDSNLLL
ncbi:hypothetical protein ASZ90_018399 [hydrocarbon metagenome]|uniref:Uncharacterized protein n=1 Tax=hydrocarbon metagenome TaxID=938273 RepID=A0A0W8E6Z3_9ZZZZ